MAIRSTAAHYPFEEEVSLRRNAESISQKLKEALQAKLANVGVVVEEVRLSHLAYAPEIASSMLRRQQAEAILESRKYLIKNALTIVDSVLDHFIKDGKLEISNDKKVEIINNLLLIKKHLRS